MATTSRLTWHGDTWLTTALAGAAHGVELGMEHVLTEANRIVPLDEGTLERSGKAHMDATGSSGAIEGAVSYDTPYAVRQHEELSYRHLPGRSAKYLETPMIAEAPTVLAIIGANIRTAGAGGASV